MARSGDDGCRDLMEINGFEGEVFEGLGTPFQKTSLLGGVTQILIYPRPSPMSS